MRGVQRSSPINIEKGRNGDRFLASFLNTSEEELKKETNFNNNVILVIFNTNLKPKLKIFAKVSFVVLKIKGFRI